MNAEKRKTKDELFNEKLRSIPTIELIETAHEQLSRLCKTGGRDFTMTVPCQTNDTDIVFAEVLRRLKEAESQPKQLTDEDILRVTQDKYPKDEFYESDDLFKKGLYRGHIYGMESYRSQTGGGVDLEWIDVNDRLPEEKSNGYSDFVLVSCGGFVYRSRYDHKYNKWLDEPNVGTTRFTHWMPLPKPKDYITQRNQQEKG